MTCSGLGCSGPRTNDTAVNGSHRAVWAWAYPPSRHSYKVGLVYAARASLDRSAIQVDGASVPLLAGMATSVEIKTGERRLIEFFLSPFSRHAREALRER
jgi:hypothetical protein